MTLLFLDTEFTQLRADEDVHLISIGLVDESDKRTFYAEMTDTYTSENVTDFVREAVLPLLEGDVAEMTFAELTIKLGDWIRSFGEPVEIAVDNLAADWTWIQVILSEEGASPANLSRRPVLLTMNHLVDYDKFLAGVEQGFRNGLRRHHALDDARSNRLGFIAAGELWRPADDKLNDD